MVGILQIVATYACDQLQQIFVWDAAVGQPGADLEGDVRGRGGDGLSEEGRRVVERGAGIVYAADLL